MKMRICSFAFGLFAAIGGAVADDPARELIAVFDDVCLGSGLKVEAVKAKLRSRGWRPVEPQFLKTDVTDSDSWVDKVGAVTMKAQVSDLTLFSCSITAVTSDFAALKARVSALGGATKLDEEVGGMKLFSVSTKRSGAGVLVGLNTDGPKSTLVVAEEGASSRSSP